MIVDPYLTFFSGNCGPKFRKKWKKVKKFREHRFLSALAGITDPGYNGVNRGATS
jgi:hypothetical protein